MQPRDGPQSLLTSAPGPCRTRTRPGTGTAPRPAALERAKDSPVRLGEEELRPVSCHGGRVPGVGGQLRRCPLRVRIVGLDEGDVAQQRGVGRPENLLSHLQWVVRRHLQAREEGGVRSSRAHRFQTSCSPTLTLTSAPALSPTPLSHCGARRRQVARLNGASVSSPVKRANTTSVVWGLSKRMNVERLRHNK